MLIKGLFLLVMLATCAGLSAQLCQGSLGDPIINKTFGAGSNPGPSLGRTTSMSFYSSDCPNDGSYTVRSNTSQCFGNTWHTLNSDHTGDANGYFMLINASIDTSEFYNDTVRGLCPNTTYEFAAWIINVILPSSCGGNTIRPNLTFRIQKTDGTLLQTYNTGDIAPTSSPQWQQSGFFFTTAEGSPDVVLRISNNSKGGCGNDLGIDDITFRPCGPLLKGSIEGISETIKNLCVGFDQNVKLLCSVSSGFSNPYFQWQASSDNGASWTDIPGANTTTYTVSVATTTPIGNYLYRLTVAESANRNLSACKVASLPLTVRVNGKPQTSTTTNSPVCTGSTITLTARGGADYKWTGVNSFSASGAVVNIEKGAFINAGKYYVTVTDANGCVQQDSAVIDLLQSPKATVAFTNKTICQGETVPLSSSGGTIYKWLPATGLSDAGIADPVAQPALTTAYAVAVGNGTCADTATVSITVLTAPRAEAGPVQYIREGQSVQLQSSAQGGNLVYNWSPPVFISDPKALQPIASPVSTTTYLLSAVSSNGCGAAFDSTTVVVYKNVIVPNAFSPNNDGVNDTWNIKALNTYNDYELSVFNRYGQVVYTTRNYSQPWNGTYNGKSLPSGTYYYLIDLMVSVPKLTGYVVILR